MNDPRSLLDELGATPVSFVPNTFVVFFADDEAVRRLQEAGWRPVRRGSRAGMYEIDLQRSPENLEIPR